MEMVNFMAIVSTALTETKIGRCLSTANLGFCAVYEKVHYLIFCLYFSLTPYTYFSKY